MIVYGIIEEGVEDKIGIIVFSKREQAEAAVEALKSDKRYEMTITPANDELIEKIKKTKTEIQKKLYEGSNLVIKNLPKQIDDTELYKIFSKFGKVSSARVLVEPVMKEIKDESGEIVDKELTYESKGIGFVLYKNAEDAGKAKEQLNEIETCIDNIAMKLTIEFYDYNKKEKNKIDEIRHNMQSNENMQGRGGARGGVRGAARGVRGRGGAAGAAMRYFNDERQFFQELTNMRGGRGGYKKFNTFEQAPNNMANRPNPVAPNMNMNRMNAMPMRDNNMMGRFQGPMPNMNGMNFPQNAFMGGAPNMMPNPNQIQQQQPNQPPIMNKKITVEEFNLVGRLKAVIDANVDEERAEDETIEGLGEIMFQFLSEFIPQYNLNISDGKLKDIELCSKLTGILIKTDYNTLLEIVSSTDKLYNSLKDISEKIISTYNKI